MRLRFLAAVLADGVRGLLRGRGLSLSAVLVIALTFGVAALCLLAGENLAAAVARHGRPGVLRVYFDASTPTARATALAFRLRDRAEIAAATRIDPEQARASFQASFPEMADLPDLLGENPFPPHVEIELRPGVDAAGRAALVAELEAEDQVLAVLGDDLWAARLLGLADLVRRSGQTAGLIFALAAALVVSGIIRLSLAARREEIQVMAVVGAPRLFMAGPFVVEGALQGGLGALLAVGGAWGAFRLAGALAAEYPLLGFVAITPLPAQTAVSLILLAAAAGAAGALLALRRSLFKG
jgi:cell division transport system permease protein